MVYNMKYKPHSGARIQAIAINLIDVEDVAELSS